MQALKTIIFDLGNVIIPFDFRRGYALLESHVNIAAAEIPERIRLTGLVPQLESGRIAPRDFVEAINRELDTHLMTRFFARSGVPSFCRIPDSH